MSALRPRVAAKFAVLSASRITDGDAAEAVRLCAEGLAMFPDYLGGYVVLARAYDALGKPDDAYIIRTEAHRRFPWLPWVGPLGDGHGEAIHPEVHDKPATETGDTVEADVAQPTLHLAEPDSREDVDQVRHGTDVATEQSAHVTPVVQADAASANGLPQQTQAVAHPHPAVDEPLVEHEYSLRLITSAMPADDTRIIRSAAVRLIPGLEYTSLRFEGVKQRGRRSIQQLLDPPAFRTFHTPVRLPRRSAAVPVQETPSTKRPLSLEELAARLERARMPRASDVMAGKAAAGAQVSREAAPAPVVPQAPPGSVVVASETMARIYAAQGSFDLALDVYRTLQQQQPDRHDYFQTLIDSIAAKRSS